MLTPCMTRVKKSQRRIAPRSIGTKSNPGEAIVLRYRVMNPHSTMSIATHAKIGNTRTGLPRMR